MRRKSVSFTILMSVCCAWSPLPVKAELSLANQAERAFHVGDYETAEGYYKAALNKASKNHDQAYTFALGRLANCYYMAGKLAKAEQTYKKMLATNETLHGPESMSVADNLFGLTKTLRRQRRYEEAEPVILRTLSIRQKVLGGNDRLVSSAWLDLAVNYERQGKLEDAEAAFGNSIAIRKQNELSDGKALGVAYHLYAQLLFKLGRSAEANELERRAKELVPLYRNETGEAS